MSMPTSRDEPAVTIENLARNVPRVSKFEGKSKLRGKVNVEGNVSPRAILTKDGVKKVDVKTANALLELGSIIDLGKGVFLDADIAASAFGGKVGDEFRYGDIGLDEVGIGIGKKIGDSGQLGLKGTYRPGRGGQEDDYAVGLSYDRKFNKGGVVDMRQMEMFNIGGLKDEGGSKDSVSGNVVPSGSLKEEVRDDIDAKLSPGEFVFPADVVRYIGLEKLMLMRDKAKKGLKRMEAMGQMGNSEEATLDDDVPFEQSDLLIVAGSPMEEQMNALNRGGMPIRASNGTAVPTTGTPVTAPGSGLGAGRGDQLLGSNLQQYFNPETNEIRSVLVSRDNLTGELKPVSPLPEGFMRDTPENRTNAMKPTDTSARVETAVPKAESSSMDPEISTTSVSEMSPSQRADLGQFYSDNPIAGKVAETVGNFASASISRGFGAPVVGPVMGLTGAVMTAMDDTTLSEIGKSMLGFGTKGQGTLDREAVEAALAGRKNNTAEYQQAVKDYADKLSKSIDTNLAGFSAATVAAAKATTFGASSAQMAAHAEAVSRGDRPEGSSPNDAGGYSTIGPNTPFGYSTNEYGEVDYNQTQRDKQKQKEKELKDRQAEVEKQDKFSFSMSDEPGGEAIGGPDTQGGKDQASDPAETGTAQAEEETFTAVGGFIPKKKKQKKKKRGGLASRK